MKRRLNFGDQCLPVRPFVPYGSEQAMRFLVRSDKLADVGDGHEQCTANISCLPLHPVSLGGIDNCVSLADLYVPTFF